ncbi:MAG: ion transporter [Zetaproteobacteria bacterium]|nr:MAG: ion transporter [Zetaproteobacteria bacterium]
MNRTSRISRFRSQLYGLLEEQESLASRLFNGFIMFLILANVLAVVLESVRSIRLAHEAFFQGFEIFSIVVFTLEYLLRVWVCTEKPIYFRPVRGRLRYMVSFMAIVDLLAILPFYLSMFVTLDTRFLRVLRLLRVFKLTRHFQSLEILIQVLRMEAPVLGSSLLMLLVLAVLAAGGIYVVEHDAQPEAFGSIPAALWWAIVTLTTVGYGDVVPQTDAGRFFALIITMLGVGMAALPAGIIAGGFSREMQKRREIYQTRVREALEDGVITSEEQEHLEQIRRQLGLDIEDARAVTRAEFNILSQIGQSRCPHCGKSLLGNREDDV